MHKTRTFEPKDPDWEVRVRASYEKQGVMRLIGARLAELRPGYCEIHLPWRTDLTQQNGYFHAGVIATVVDSAAGYAGFTLMPAGSSVLSVEFKLNLLSPGDGELLIATGEVIKPGKTLVITRGEAYVVKGGQTTHCSTMQQTLMTMHGKPEK
ncbi:MAG TPA: PaaI family thioesterase [Rhodocyclaceae bacterium]|nr:PaaI family thioesterase [Rhodocyclaceae bacterium]